MLKMSHICSKSTNEKESVFPRVQVDRDLRFVRDLSKVRIRLNDPDRFYDFSTQAQTTNCSKIDLFTDFQTGIWCFFVEILLSVILISAGSFAVCWSWARCLREVDDWIDFMLTDKFAYEEEDDDDYDDSQLRRLLPSSRSTLNPIVLDGRTINASFAQHALQVMQPVYNGWLYLYIGCSYNHESCHPHLAGSG